jgi:putative transposase
MPAGDGAMSFWAALEEVFPQTRHQRCWFHKMGNVLNTLPKSLQARAKADMQAIWMASTRDEARAACTKFVERYKAKYPKSMEKVERVRDSLLAFYGFPAEHWQHIRTISPIESTSVTERVTPAIACHVRRSLGWHSN